MAILFSDNFNRSNGALGGNWVHPSPGFEVNNNQLYTESTFSYSYNTTSLGTNNYKISIDFNTAQGKFVQIWGRATADTDAYILYVETNTNNFSYLYKVIAGAYTLVGGPYIFTPGSSIRKFTLSMNGTSIALIVDGVTIGSATDSSITSGPHHGPRLGGASYSDNYIVEDFTVATTTSTSSTTSTSTTTTTTSTSTTTSSSTSTSTSTISTTTSTSTSTTLDPTTQGGLAFGVQTPDIPELPVSWATWGLSGGQIIGDGDWGKLQLNLGDSGYSKVYDFGQSSNKNFTITSNKYGSGQGSSQIQIRGHNTTQFLETDMSPSWENYTAPVLKTWRYVQIRSIK